MPEKCYRSGQPDVAPFHPGVKFSIYHHVFRGVYRQRLRDPVVSRVTHPPFPVRAYAYLLPYTQPVCTAAMKHIYLYTDALRTFVYFCHSDLSCIDHFSNVSVNVTGDAHSRVLSTRVNVQNLEREKKCSRVFSRDNGCTCGIQRDFL